jgi:hypothetical protein
LFFLILIFRTLGEILPLARGAAFDFNIMGDAMAVPNSGEDQGSVSMKTGPWSDADIEKLIQLWNAGESNSAIAAKLGRRENAVAIKASRLHLPPKSSASGDLKSPQPSGSKARLRPCLKCERTFYSEGSHHRICDACKSSSVWSSGDYAVSYGGSF